MINEIEKEIEHLKKSMKNQSYQLHVMFCISQWYSERRA